MDDLLHIVFGFSWWGDNPDIYVIGAFTDLETAQAARSAQMAQDHALEVAWHDWSKSVNVFLDPSLDRDERIKSIASRKLPPEPARPVCDEYSIVQVPMNKGGHWLVPKKEW